MKFKPQNNFLLFAFIGLGLLIFGTFLLDKEINDGFMSIGALPLFVLIFGLIFFILGAGITLKEYIRRNIIQRLLSVGIKVQAKFLRAERYSPSFSLSSGYGQKNSKAYRLVVQFIDNNRDYIFFSDPIPYDPSKIIKSELIDVYVDSSNYKKYYVDLSILPEKNELNLNASSSQEKYLPPVTWLTVLWKIVNGLIFVYIASITYHNLKINGVNYGIYLRPIAALPPYPFIVIAFVTHYFLQKQEEKAIVTVSTVKSDFLQVSNKLISQNPIKTVQKYLWNSVKIIVKNAVIFFFLMIPIMMFFSVIQLILTGNGDITATY